MRIIGLIAIIALINTHCINYFGRTRLHHDVSIWLPSDFIQVDISSDYKLTVYKSQNNADELHVASHFFNAIGSSSTERKEKIVESNLENIAKSANGKNVNKQDLRTIKSMIQNEYSMIIEENDSSTVLYAKVVNKGPNVLLLKYYTPQPEKETSIKRKVRIFKSIRIK